MSSLKKLQEQQKQLTAEKTEQPITDADKLAVQVMLENSVYYLMGAYTTYCLLNKLEYVDMEQMTTMLNVWKQSEDTEKLFTENPDNSLYIFLKWYLNNDNSRS